jgi:glycosyltransferase involved in cell wall biosynthesis
MKLLYYGESPLNATGFGNVNKHVLAACARVADEVTMVASTHYYPEYDREKYPYEIVACEDDGARSMQNQRNLANIEKYVKSLDWDVFFYQGDMGANNDVLAWVKEIQEVHPEKNSIFYMPIDGDISLGFAFAPFTWCSAPVVYTNHAKSVVEKYQPNIAKNVSVIWLGCETDVFYPLPEEEKLTARRNIFGEQCMDRFIVLNVNRNQVRKDLARCMGAFHLFHEKHPESSLYMHSVQNDAGGCLPIQAMLVGCDVEKRPGEILFSNLDLADPPDRETLNKLYNAVDCLVSTSYGEGWGLTTTEAMCAGTPVMVPENTANLDILGGALWAIPGYEGLSSDRERGWAIKVGGDLDHTSFIYQTGGGPTAHIHAQSFVDNLEYIYEHREEAQEKAARAVQWCQENTWQRRESEWEQLLRIMKSSLTSNQLAPVKA